MVSGRCGPVCKGFSHDSTSASCGALPKRLKGGAPHAAPALSLGKSGDSSCLDEAEPQNVVLSGSALPFSSLAPEWSLPERGRARGQGGGSGAGSQ
jgi:hypothetical protein